MKVLKKDRKDSERIFDLLTQLQHAVAVKTNGGNQEATAQGLLEEKDCQGRVPQYHSLQEHTLS